MKLTKSQFKSLVKEVLREELSKNYRNKSLKEDLEQEFLTGDDLRETVDEEMGFIYDELGEDVSFDDAYEYIIADCEEAGIQYDPDELESILGEYFDLDENLSSKTSIKESDESDKDEWFEISNLDDLIKFSEGTRWIFSCLDKEAAEHYYKGFTKNGEKFYGKGEGDSRQLKTVSSDGKVFGPYDIENHKVK